MNRTSSPDQCDACAFYEAADRTTGKCRRYPPVRTAPKVSAFPTTFHAAWCGEFRASLPSDAVGLVDPPTASEAPVSATLPTPANIGETTREPVAQPLAGAMVPGMTKTEPAPAEPAPTTPQRPKLPRPSGGPVAIAP